VSDTQIIQWNYYESQWGDKGGKSESTPEPPKLIRQAIEWFGDWNSPSRTRLERHEALNAFLFQCSSTESRTVEALFHYGKRKNGKPRRGRVDFLGSNLAVEIDHSMKPRSLEKLVVAREKGYLPIWIILRGTGSFPRKFGQMQKKANALGVSVVILRHLQGHS